MKKVVVVLLLFVLLAFCAIAGVGGFYGYRWYKIKKHQAMSGTSQDVPLFPWQKAKEPTPAPTPTEEPPTNEPGIGDTEPGTPPAPEQQLSNNEIPPPPPTPAPDWATDTPKPKTPKETPKPKEPAPKPKDSGWTSYSTNTTTEPPPITYPPPTTTEPTPPPTYEPSTPPSSTPYEPPKKKTPKGTLGVIFETTVEKGDVLLHVDEQLVEKQTFTASSSQKFRLAKNVLLPPGPHKVRLSVVGPDGKTQGKEWQVEVAEAAVTIWKGEMKSFRGGIELKQIPQ